MLRSVIAIVISAFTLTATCAVERADGAVGVQPRITLASADVVKASLVRKAPVAPPEHAAAPAEAPAKDSFTGHPTPSKVDFEMVVAALALMLVVALRRFRSGPR